MAYPSRKPPLEQLAEGVLFAGDELHVRDPELRQRLDRPTWSPSSAKAFGKCPSGWAFSRFLPETTDPFALNALGTSAHRVFEILFNLPAKERTLDLAMEILTGLHDDSAVTAPTDPADLFRWRAEVANRVQPLWKIEDPMAVEVHSTEMQLDGVLVGGAPVKGFIDRVDRLPSGLLRIVDYKAGKERRPSAEYGDDHGDQLILYSLGVEAKTGVKPDEVAIYYTSTGNSRVVDFTPESAMSVAHHFGDTFRESKERASVGIYPTRATPLCGWCPLATACPTAAAAGKSRPKIPEARSGTVIGIRTEAKPSLAPVLTDPDLDLPSGLLPAEQFALDSVRAGVAAKTIPQPFLDVEPDEDDDWLGDGYSVPGDFDEPVETPSAPTSLQPASLHPTALDRTTMAVQPVPASTWAPPGLPAYEETSTDGRLSANSYASTAVFGITAWSMELLAKYNQPLTKTGIESMARTLASVILRAQHAITGHTSFHHGMNQRVRGALHAVIDLSPPPFGASESEWIAWADRAVARIVFIAHLSHTVWQFGPGERPYEGLLAPVGSTSTVHASDPYAVG